MSDHDALLLRLFQEALACDECAEVNAFLRAAIRQGAAARRTAGLSLRDAASELGGLLASVAPPALRPGRQVLLRARVVQWVVESYLPFAG